MIEGHLAVSDCDIVHRPLLGGGSSLKPVDLAQQWSETCTTGHSACRLNFGGVEVGEAIVDRPALEKTLFINIFDVDGIGPSRIPTDNSVLIYALCFYATAPSLSTLLRPLVLCRYAVSF